MKRFDALSNAPLPSPTLFLEASAGTGKTFAIENIVVKKVLAGCPIDEILIVTFTKAATRELKSRISNALFQAFDRLEREDTASVAYLDVIEDKKSASRLLLRANQNIELIHIYTIHGFCFRMLKQFAFEADIPLVEEESDDTPFDLKGLFLDQFRSISHDHLNPVQLKLLLRHHRNDFKKLLVSLERQLLFDGKVQKVESFEVLLEKFRTCLEGLESIEKEKLMEDLTKMMASHQKCLDRKKQLHKPFERQLECFMTWLYTKKVHLKEFEMMLFEKVYFFEYFIPKYQKKSVETLPRLHYGALLESVRSQLIPLLHQAKSPHYISLYLLGLFQPRIQEQIEKNPTAHPDALLKKMDESLFKEPFLKQVRQLFRVAIIDEFQDTDPIQWSLLERLFLYPNIDLFAVVGDPKQSIYSFRAADLAVYERAKAKMGSLYALDTNYRSDPKLMAGVNHLFDHEKLFTFEASDLDLNYTPVQSGLQEKEEGELSLCYAYGERQKSGAWPSLSMEEKVFIPHIRNAILDLYAKGIKLDEMAILVKDRYQAKRIQSSLMECDIPSHSLRVSSIAKTQAWRFLLLFLQALENPYSESDLKGVMAHRFMGLNAQDLIDENVRVTWQKRFIEMRFHIDQIGLSGGWNCFLHYDHNRFYSRLVEGQNGADYTDFETLIEQLLGCESELGLGLSGLIRFLQELKESDPDSEPKAKRRLSKAVKGVQIMTTHMSKGLEFSVVFALGIACRTPQTNQLISIDKTIRLYNEDEQAVIDKMSKLDEEKLRQFYVALTRAKSKLFAYCALEKEEAVIRYGEASPIELYLAKRNQADQSYAAVYKRISTLDKLDDGVELNEDHFHRRLTLFEKKKVKSELPQFQIDFFPRRITSFSGLTQHITAGQKVEVSDERSIQNLPAGALVGTIVHSIFEMIIEQNFLNPYCKNEIVRIVEQMCRLSPLEGFEEEVMSMVDQALHIPLIGKARCIDLTPKKISQEVEFIFSENEKLYLKGFADLIFEYEEKIYILDWKTNRLDNYSQEALKSAMEHHNYHLQGSIYAKALKKALALQNDTPFGGAIYLFLRGVDKGEGVYHFIPEETLCLN